MGEPADRELRAEVHVRATPAQVWAVLADLSRMPELSNELVRLVALKPGGLRRGQWYLGINRRGWVLWPSRSVVSTVERDRLVAWDTRSSGARWIWELTPEDAGTLVVHRRPVPRRLTWLTRVFAGVFLGGAAGHTDDLERDMRQSAERLKAAVEASGADSAG